MEYNMKVIGERIRSEREDRKWSQEEFIFQLSGRGCKIGRNVLSNIENGVLKSTADLRLNFLLASAALFNCEVGYLLCDPEYEQKTRGNTDIANETGLSLSAIQHLKICKKEDQEHELAFLNFLLFGSRFSNLADLFYRFIHPTIDMVLVEDTETGELKAVTEKVFDDASSGSSTLKPHRVLVTLSEDDTILGFSRDMVDQSVYHKLTYLFEKWRKAWANK